MRSGGDSGGDSGGGVVPFVTTATTTVLECQEFMRLHQYPRAFQMAVYMADARVVGGVKRWKLQISGKKHKKKLKKMSARLITSPVMTQVRPVRPWRRRWFGGTRRP